MPLPSITQESKLLFEEKKEQSTKRKTKHNGKTGNLQQADN
jgi:hypothetical protein